MTRSKGRTGRPYRRLRDSLKASGAPCWVCGQHINTSLPWWSPWSFSVDHIVPLVAGGAPLARDNVAPAHRRCNQLRNYGLTPEGPAPVEVSGQPSRAW